MRVAQFAEYLFTVKYNNNTNLEYLMYAYRHVRYACIHITLHNISHYFPERLSVV